MGKYDVSSDTEILSLLKQDNALAFEELYNRYWEKMYSSVFQRLKDGIVAEEIVQDLFADIWNRRYTLPTITIVSAYLQTAIRYRVINYIRKKIRKNNLEQYVALYHLDFDNSTEEQVFYNDLRNHIHGEVNMLPVRCREVYSLSRDSYKTNKEIATTLGISEKAVEKQITKALKFLKSGLNSFLLL